MGFDNAFGFEEKGRIPIRDEASTCSWRPDDSLEPRLDLTHKITRAQPHEIGLGFVRDPDDYWIELIERG